MHEKLENAILDDVDFTKTCIGGDHGKNTYLLIAIVLFRCKRNFKGNDTLSNQNKLTKKIIQEMQRIQAKEETR